MASEIDSLIRKLEAVGELSEADRQILRELPVRIAHLERGEEACRDGEVMNHSCLVIDGWMHRSKVLPDGKRQILSFHPRGDIPDLQSLHLKRMDHSLVATRPCKVGYLAHSDLKAVIRQSPTLNDLLWRDTLIEAAKFRMWVVMMGQADATTHMAHFFCELFVCQQVNGNARGSEFDFPVTQAELGEALGSSAVHVNRTLQELRALNLFSFDAGRVTVLDWDRLREIGQFDPEYLHFRKEAAGL